MWFRLRRFP